VSVNLYVVDVELDQNSYDNKNVVTMLASDICRCLLDNWI